MKWYKAKKNLSVSDSDGNSVFIKVNTIIAIREREQTSAYLLHGKYYGTTIYFFPSEEDWYRY